MEYHICKEAAYNTALMYLVRKREKVVCVVKSILKCCWWWWQPASTGWSRFFSIFMTVVQLWTPFFDRGLTPSSSPFFQIILIHFVSHTLQTQVFLMPQDQQGCHHIQIWTVACANLVLHTISSPLLLALNSDKRENSCVCVRLCANYKSVNIKREKEEEQRKRRAPSPILASVL